MSSPKPHFDILYDAESAKTDSSVHHNAHDDDEECPICDNKYREECARIIDEERKQADEFDEENPYDDDDMFAFDSADKINDYDEEISEEETAKSLIVDKMYHYGR